MKKIDIGCGRYKVEGTLGVDIMEHENVDIVHDLNTSLTRLRTAQLMRFTVIIF